MSEGPRVLLVDDNEAMLDRVAALLGNRCDVVARATEGHAVLEAALRLQPELIVMDISMPDMTGLEVAVQLRRFGVNAAIVFLTVHEDLEFVRAATAAGGIGYVIKRRLASDLKLAVSEALEGRPFLSPLR